MSIIESVISYKRTLMEDINFSLRLTYQQQQYVTKPAEWIEDVIILEAPMKGPDYILLPTNTVLDVTLVCRTALFHTKLRIIKNHRKNESLYYMAEIIEPLVKKQQREAFRLNVLLDVNYHTLPIDDFTPSPSGTLEGKGTCLNISTGGMCLACKHQLRGKDKIQLDFSLVDEPLTLTGEILFLGEPTEVGTYTHRIRFTSLDSVTTNHLNRLIFKKQRLQLRCN